MVLGTDQGTTISLDRGQTWSSWYNQPTAQLYHVITDNQFPYVVYGAQQDSGAPRFSAAPTTARSRRETGFLPAPARADTWCLDPNDPNIIYLSGAYGTVDRFDRRTGLSQDISPWPFDFGMPRSISENIERPGTPVLVFSPADPTTLYLRRAVCDEDCRWRPALGDDQPRSDEACSTPDEMRQNQRSRTTVENARERGLWSCVHDRALASQSRFDLGGKRYGIDSPYARWRENLEGRYAAGSRRLEQDFTD